MSTLRGAGAVLVAATRLRAAKAIMPGTRRWAAATLVELQEYQGDAGAALAQLWLNVMPQDVAGSAFIRPV
ncbi:hypothetical protein KCP71_11700 [Salmonella enterica subsp. enterica]|nr:hypothetical protein KCP71_11700 [Salmonella enterica subsp. enterica]